MWKNRVLRFRALAFELVLALRVIGLGHGKSESPWFRAWNVRIRSAEFLGSPGNFRSLLG